jgi:hypothetical protein
VISYSARVVPVGKPATVRGDQGQPVTFTFDEHDFSVTRAILRNGGDIPILLNHIPDLRIGRLRSLEPGRTWWAASFELDEDAAAEFDVGQNVSVGLEWFVEDASGPRRVSELSVVRRGLIPGAEITHRVELEPKPAEAPRSPAAVPSSSDRAAAGDDFDDYRPPLWDELEREVGLPVYDGPSFERAMILWHRAPAEKHLDEVMATRRTGTLVRPNIGQVLGVR